jgi:hypothetical protein
MMNLIDILAVVGMFALRIGVPIAVMSGMVYLLKRLDQRWEAEARAQQQARMSQQAAEQPAQRPSERPAPGKRVPAPSAPIPFIPPPAYPTSPQPGLMMAQPSQSCWDRWGCSESAKAKCAAPQHPGVPCWQARFDAEGKIPEACVNCEYFQRYPLM